MDLRGPVVPARLKPTISGKFLRNNVIAHVKSTDARTCGRSSIVKVSAHDRKSQRVRPREECVGVR